MLGRQKCVVCGEYLTNREKVKVLGKYDTTITHCGSCGFTSLNNVTWLDEAYSNVIANTDTGLVARNLYVGRKILLLLRYLDNFKGNYLDIAGGYGLLVRLMRDRGLNYYWTDEYCENIFAKQFDIKDFKDKVDFISAIEVLEHIDNPIDFIRSNMDGYGAEFFMCTTLLYQGNEPPRSEDWWYYCLNTGQHISFYSRTTLKRIAFELDLHVYSNGIFHLFSKRRLNSTALKFIMGRGLSMFYRW